MKKLLSLIIFILFMLFAVSVTLQNKDSVTLNYYFGITAQVDVFVLLVVPFVIGMLLGVLLMSISVMRNRLQLGKVKRQLAKTEKEMESLRTAPITQAMPGSVGTEKVN